MELVKKDTTSKIINVFVRDSVTGQGKTGITDTAMSGWYTDGNSASISLSFAPGSVGDTYSSGKWAEQGNGNYKYHAPNGMFDQFGVVRARFASAGAVDVKMDFQVVAFDPEDLIDSNIKEINNNPNSAINLALSANQIVPGTVSNAVSSPTTTNIPTSITEATLDHYNGRVMIFTSGALNGQATNIVGYSLVSGEGVFVVTALTEAPTNGMTFILV